jgi:3-hydroxyisobutyrate dehydrogenase-like beta-hydroxyacid dehydrogenase
MSTVSVSLSRRLAAAHEHRIQRYVAAPLFRGRDAAVSSELCIFAGGRRDIVSYCQPLFDAIAPQTIEVSEDPAEANLLQLCSLGLIGSLVESLGEAVALAQHGGIAADRFFKLMAESLFSRGLHASYGALLSPVPPRLVTVTQARKSAGLLLDAAKTVGAATPLMDLLSDRLGALEELGMGDVDWLAHSMARGSGGARGLR